MSPLSCPPSYSLMVHTVAVKNVRAKLLNETAIKLSWSPVKIPDGVTLLQYSIYCSDSNGRIIMHSVFPPNQTRGVFGGLASETVYTFVALARIQDVDGSIMESPPSHVTSESTIFLPCEPYSNFNVDSLLNVLYILCKSHYCLGLPMHLHAMCGCRTV